MGMGEKASVERSGTVPFAYRLCERVEVCESRATEKRSRIQEVGPKLEFHGIKFPL